MSVFFCEGQFWWRQIWRHLHVTMMQRLAKFSNVLVHWSIRMICAKKYETGLNLSKLRLKNTVASIFFRTRCIVWILQFLRSHFLNKCYSMSFIVVCSFWQRTLLSQLRTRAAVLTSNLSRKSAFLTHPTFNRFVLCFGHSLVLFWCYCSCKLPDVIIGY